MPYVIVAEQHADGHLHAHVLLDRFVPADLLSRLWGHGFVDVRKFRGGSAREAARKAGAYASKYVGKAFHQADGGKHRYEVGEGFQPAVVKRGGFRSLAAAIDFVCDHGEAVGFAIHSDTVEYEGPAWLWVALRGQDGSNGPDG